MFLRPIVFFETYICYTLLISCQIGVIWLSWMMVWVMMGKLARGGGGKVARGGLPCARHLLCWFLY
jgi:hypothetical protein